MKMSPKKIVIILAVLTTSVLHFAAAFDRVLFPDGPDPLFILNGLGYLGLLGAYFLPIPLFQDRHKLVRWVLMGFAVLTIVLWIYIWVFQFVIVQGVPFFSRDSWYGVPAKIAEVILLAALWSDKE